MRFSFKKTLSMLHFHRRVKSESSIVYSTVPKFDLDTIAHSVSLFNIEPVLGPSNPMVPIGDSAVASTTRTPITPSDVYLVPQELCSSRTTCPEIAVLKRRIAQLEADNINLSNHISSVVLDAAIKEEENTQLRGDLLAEKLEGYAHRRATKEGEIIQEHERHRMVQLERFISAMIDLGLHIPVLDKARTAVIAGELADDALVDAIKEAAERPGTAWSRIIPAIVGPRTDENYISAINVTIKTRKELRHVRKVARFWKSRTKRDSANQYIITPSSSNLSDITEEELVQERQTAVDDLLKRLRNGENPCRRGPLALTAPQRDQGLNAIDVSGNSEDGGESDDTTERPPSVATEAPPSPNCFSRGDELASLPSHSQFTSQKNVTNSSQAISSLAPLASQIFKKELIASCSIGKLSATSHKSNRPILGNVDTNITRGSSCHRLSRTSITASNSRLSAKALGKLAEIDRAEPSVIEPQLCANKGHKNNDDAVAKTTPESHTSTDDHTNLCDFSQVPTSEIFPISPPTSGTAQNEDDGSQRSVYHPSLPSVDEGRLAALDALASLERMCATLSSGSFGSLEAVGEAHAGETSSSSLDSGPRPTTTSDSLVTTAVIFDTPKPVAVSRPAKKSMLPVFKSLRRLSTSFHAPKRPVAATSPSPDRPTKSSALKAVSPTKPKPTTQIRSPKAKITKLTTTPVIPPVQPPLTGNASPIPSQVPRGSHNQRMVDKGKRAVKSWSRILS